MVTHLLYGTQILKIEVPDSSTVYGSSYPSPVNSPSDMVFDAVRRPLDSLPIREALKKRRTGDVVIVVSDITRPVPYSQFLNVMLEEIKSAGVKGEDILILIATGMHRQSTQSEREQMYGSEVNKNYRIVDHSAVCDDDLVELDGKSQAGNPVRLNRHYVEAGFRIVTGLVEPHFMAGFSGGRKAICPGLVSLESVHKFHGYSFLASPAARNGNLQGNPCHEEALSMARLAGVDFSLNIVLNKDRQVVRAFAGDLEVSHRVACECVLKYACPRVVEEHDIVLTSSGGCPLDATFYQCVKGMVSCLPAVKKNGMIVLVGGCLEGVGSLEYKEILYRYSGRWKEFLKDIEKSEVVMRDQWEFQMQTRALEKIGQQNLFFITDSLPANELEKLSINGIPSEPGKVGDTVQEVVDKLLVQDMKLVVIPEGPYCAPLE